jgi:DNA repair protein RecN (Recombination protein N)
MLRSLEIVNYALIDHLFVELYPQLNIITGETGAGKSILVDALSMVLGGRASVDFIRTGEDRFSLEAEFFLGESHLRNTAIDDFSEGTGVLNLRRELSSSGRSRCYANGNPLSVKALREIGKLLVDLHGQHDHQSILDVQKHLDYLDDYGNLGKGREKVECIYRKLTDLNKRREKASWESEQLLARRDLLEHQIEEIRFAELQPGEDEALALKLERLSHSERLREIVFQLKEILYEKNDSVAEALGVGIKLAEEGAGNDNFVPPLRSM